MKNVFLRPLGEPPTWGTADGHNPMDDRIFDLKHGPFEDQHELFFRFARQLYDHQTKVPEAERLDGSDDEEWLRRLAYWFSWPDEVQQNVKREAMRSAMEVLDYEIEDDPGT